MQDLTFLKIDRLIIHELPNRDRGTTGVVSDDVSPLPKGVRHFFEERIRFALTYSGIPVEFQANPSSPVPGLVGDSLSVRTLTPKAFVAASQKVARHLFEITTGVHSEGLICVVYGSLQSARAMALVKLENEEGLRAKLKGSAGNQRFEIEVVPDLMLTQHTRVFKVALFEQTTTGTVEALACDNQRARGQLLAEYFLAEFLGCQLVAKPDVTTRKFLEITETFINSLVSDPTARSRYHTALLAELGSNNTSIRARNFADDHLAPEDRPGYLTALKEADVPTTFKKDTALVKNRLHRTRYDFDGDISVSVPPSAIDDSVTLTDADGGKTRLELEARLQSVHGVR